MLALPRHPAISTDDAVRWSRGSVQSDSVRSQEPLNLKELFNFVFPRRFEDWEEKNIQRWMVIGARLEEGEGGDEQPVAVRCFTFDARSLTLEASRNSLRAASGSCFWAGWCCPVE